MVSDRTSRTASSTPARTVSGRTVTHQMLRTVAAPPPGRDLLPDRRHGPPRSPDGRRTGSPPRPPPPAPRRINPPGPAVPPSASLPGHRCAGTKGPRILARARTIPRIPTQPAPRAGRRRTTTPTADLADPSGALPRAAERALVGGSPAVSVSPSPTPAPLFHRPVERGRSCAQDPPAHKTVTMPTRPHRRRGRPALSVRARRRCLRRRRGGAQGTIHGSVITSTGAR